MYSPRKLFTSQSPGSHMCPAKILLLGQAAAPYFTSGSAQLQQRRHNYPRVRAQETFPVLRSAVVTAASSGDASKAASGNAPRVRAETTAKAQVARKAAKLKAANGNAMCVKAAFAEADLTQDAVDHVLRLYPKYLRWDVEQKLLPAIRCWQQELGDRFISEFKRIPTLLCMKPEEENEKDAYLTSIGITSPRRLRQRGPVAFYQSLNLMQGKVAFLYARGFTEAQVTSLIEQHPDILSRQPEYIEEFLKVINDMFGCAQDMDALHDVLLSCRRMGLFTVSPTALHQNFTYFGTCVGASDKDMQRAWKHGVFRASPPELDIRLDSMAAHLGAHIDEAKSMVRRQPDISTRLPATVGLHITQLLDLGFSRSQVKSMCLSQPTMVTLSYDSQLQADKWAFLTCVLQLSHGAIAAHPYLLMTSLPNRLGPRWEYLQQLRLHGLIAFTTAPQVFQSLLKMSDSQFRAAYTTPQLCVYDKHFQNQWQRRWDFLVVDQQLSIQDIANNPALLHISLKDPTGVLDC